MSIELREGERILAECRFKRGGCLFGLASILRPLIGPQPIASYVTSARVINVYPRGKTRAADRDRIEKVFWNTSSGSFHVIEELRHRGFVIALVINAEEVAAAMEELGIEVERERVSPRRPYLR